MVALVVAELLLGSVDVSFLLAFDDADSYHAKIIEGRLLKVLLAVLVGLGCALCGMVIQTLFKNPLAGPTTLGINSGASLGVGVFYLIPSVSSVFAFWGSTLFAVVGSLLFLSFLVAASRKSFNITFVLIIGLLLSYGSYALLEVMLQMANNSGMRSYVMWGMGSLSNGNWSSLLLLLLVTIVGVTYFVKKSNWLNVYNLGDAELQLTFNNPVEKTKKQLLIFSGIWIGLITCFVGPIAFVGIIVPNVLKLVLKTADFKKLIPYNIIFGAIVVLLSDLLSNGALFTMVLPLNAVLSVVGIPIIIYLLLKKTSFD